MIDDFLDRRTFENVSIRCLSAMGQVWMLAIDVATAVGIRNQAIAANSLVYGGETHIPASADDSNGRSPLPRAYPLVRKASPLLATR